MSVVFASPRGQLDSFLCKVFDRVRFSSLAYPYLCLILATFAMSLDSRSTRNSQRHLTPITSRVGHSAVCWPERIL